jgi:hypothetical protein
MVYEPDKSVTIRYCADKHELPAKIFSTNATNIEDLYKNDHLLISFFSMVSVIYVYDQDHNVCRTELCYKQNRT